MHALAMPDRANCGEPHPPRILVAEGDPHMLRLLAGALRKERYNVVAAHDGIELLEHLLRTNRSAAEPPFDAIVANVKLPDLSAVEVFRAMRSTSFVTPVVLVTEDVDAVRSEASGIRPAAILRKPLDWAAFDRAVRKLVGS